MDAAEVLRHLPDGVVVFDRNGVAVSEHGGTSVDDLLELADQLTYEATRARKQDERITVVS